MESGQMKFTSVYLQFISGTIVLMICYFNK